MERGGTVKRCEKMRKWTKEVLREARQGSETERKGKAERGKRLRKAKHSATQAYLGDRRVEAKAPPRPPAYRSHEKDAPYVNAWQERSPQPRRCEWDKCSSAKAQVQRDN